MKRVKAFFAHLSAVIRYNQLPSEERTLTFYSEGRNYWSYLGGLLETVLNTSNINICYVTSSEDDPGLKLNHPRLKTFVIGDGFIRDWMFANMKTDVMVMTMPDLNQYQVKKSSHPVHYLYVQHSLVSFQMVYRPGAFDHYDTIFCAGPHHIEEMRAIEKCYDLPAKNLFEHGYARLDSIVAENATRPQSLKSENDATHYLLAPSWGPNGTIETGVGKKIVDLLMSNGAQVTLRPHPQTIIFAKKQVDEIVNAHKDNPMFDFENNVQGQDSLHASDVMICDWSGAALDYAFGLGKPVLFIDVKRKINNPNYTDIPLEPFEVTIRDKIGQVISPENIEALLKMDTNRLPETLAENYVYNIGNSDEVGATEIIRLVKTLSKAE